MIPSLPLVQSVSGVTSPFLSLVSLSVLSPRPLIYEPLPRDAGPDLVNLHNV